MVAGLETDTAQRLRIVLGRLLRGLRPTDAALAADLSPTRASVLLNAVRNGPTRLGDIAAQEGLNPTLLSRALAHLAEDGLVTRTPDSDDRRAAWVEATPAGRELAERIHAQRTQAVEVALSQLSVEDRKAVERSLPALEELARKLQRDGG